MYVVTRFLYRERPYSQIYTALEDAHQDWGLKSFSAGAKANPKLSMEIAGHS